MYACDDKLQNRLRQSLQQQKPTKVGNILGTASLVFAWFYAANKSVPIVSLLLGHQVSAVVNWRWLGVVIGFAAVFWSRPRYYFLGDWQCVRKQCRINNIAKEQRLRRESEKKSGRLLSWNERSSVLQCTYIYSERMQKPTELINYAKLCSKNTAVAFKRDWFMQLHTPEIRRQWHFRCRRRGIIHAARKNKARWPSDWTPLFTPPDAERLFSERSACRKCSGIARDRGVVDHFVTSEKWKWLVRGENATSAAWKMNGEGAIDECMAESEGRDPGFQNE